MTKSDEAACLYRVEECRYAGPVDECGEPLPGVRGPLAVRIFRMPIARTTPKGWRIDGGKFVLRDAHKRYACPTIEEAFVSFQARKRKQAAIAARRMRDAQEAARAAARLQVELTQKMEADQGMYAVAERYSDWRDRLPNGD